MIQDRTPTFRGLGEGEGEGEEEEEEKRRSIHEGDRARRMVCESSMRRNFKKAMFISGK